MNRFFKFLGTLLFVLSVTGFYAQAQRKAPGYMGRRFLLKYDQGISWSLGTYIRGIPNLHYTLQGDYAVTKKYSVGAEYSFMTRGYMKEMGGVTHYNSVTDKSRYYKMERTYMHRVGIYTKMFSQSNGHLAPAGPYFAVGLNLYFLQGRFREYKNADYQGKPVIDKNFTVDFAPFIGGGKQYIVANRMVVSVDLRLSLPILGLARSFNNEIFGANGVTFDEKVNRNQARWTTWANTQANFLEIRVGLGTLL